DAGASAAGDADAAAGGDAAATADDAAGADAPDADTSADATAQPAAPAKASGGAGDPASIDLTAIEDFGPAVGTTDEEWADVQEQVTLFLANDGARSNRAL